MTDLLQTFAVYIRANAVVGREAIRIGAFTLTFTIDNDSPYLSYAIPDEDAEPRAHDIAMLIEAYRTRSRVPRVEFFPDLAPEVWPALQAAGFTLDDELPLMTCTTRTLSDEPVSAGVTVRAPETDADFLAAAQVQHEAYGESRPADDADVTHLRDLVGIGGIVALAERDGHPAGAGICDVIHDGYGELAGVGVRAPDRRHGVGTAVTWWLTRKALAAGARTAFLTPATAAEERIYARLGYRGFARQIHASVSA